MRSKRDKASHFSDFMQEAEKDVAVALEEMNSLSLKFKGVLEYFGEDDTVSSEGSLLHLHRFATVF